MDCSKPMSGLSLVAMMLFAVSARTSVLNGSSSARLSQPSSNASRSSVSNRPTRLERAPRPRRSSCSTRWRSSVIRSSSRPTQPLCVRNYNPPIENISRTNGFAGMAVDLIGLVRLHLSGAVRRPMISVIIPTLNAEATLGGTLSALVPAAVDGLVREVIVVDGGSADRTKRDRGPGRRPAPWRQRAERGRQLAAGAAKARFPWLLFLHADTVLEPGWEREPSRFMERVDTGDAPARGSGLPLRPRRSGRASRACSSGWLRCACRLLRLPYGDQGLLMPKSLYEEIGGYQSAAPDGGCRSGAPSRPSPDCHAAIARRDQCGSVPAGGLPAPLGRNLVCLALYALRVPTPVIRRIYG